MENFDVSKLSLDQNFDLSANQMIFNGIGK
jgi:hypothetical protein